MSNPGNKRLQRAKYGASPSAVEGSTTTNTHFTNGREMSVSRQTGSVINNGGNMMSGLYPRIGMGLGFLRRTRVAEDCGNCRPLEDVTDTTQLQLANAYISSFTPAAQTVLVTAAATALTVAAADATNATNAANASNTAPALAAEAVAIKAEADALADYNAKNAVLVAMNAKKTAADNYVAAQNATTLAAWLAA